METIGFFEIIAGVVSRLWPVWLAGAIVFAMSFSMRKRLGLYGQLIGNGIGPLFTGWMSKHFMMASLAKQGLADQFSTFEPKFCGPNVAQLGDAGPALCSAYAEGLRQSMVATVMVFFIAAVCYFLAARTFQRDRYSPAGPAP